MRRMCPPRGLHAARVNQAENSRPTCMRRMCPPRGLHAARMNQAENSRPTCMRRMCPPRGLHAARMNQAENSPQWTVFSPDSSTVAAGELAQGLHVEDMHFALVDVQQTFAGEPREQPA